MNDSLPVDPAEEYRRIPWSRSDNKLVLALLFWALLIVGLHGHAYPKFSPIDELQHADNAIKSGNFEVVNENEIVGQEVLREAACRRMDAGGWEPPPCDPEGAYWAFEFPEHGVNTTGGTNPTYYFLSGLGGRVIRAVTPINSIIAAIRLTGAFWLTAGFGLCWAIAGELGIERRQRAPAFALLLATPQIVVGYSTINLDQVILCSAALLVLLVLRFERGRTPWWVLPVTAIAAMAVERTNVLVVFAASTYLVLRSLPSRSLRPRVFLGLAISAGAVPMWWILHYTNRWAMPPVPPLDFELPRESFYAAPPDYFGGDLLLQRLGALVTPIDQPFISDVLSGQITSTVLRFTSLILIGGVMAALLVGTMRSKVSTLAIAGVIWLIAAGPMLTVAWKDNTLPIQNRYGLPLMPIFLVALSWALQRRSAQLAVGALALYANLYVVYQLGLT